MSDSDSHHFPAFDGVSVLVVGDVMLDSYWYGETQRISPEAPVPIVRVLDSEQRAGGAANVAVNVASLGARPVLLGMVGRDADAEVLDTLLRDSGVEAALLRVESARTIVKTRILSRHQQLLRLDVEDRFSDADSAVLAQAYRARVGDVAAVVLSDYAKGTLGDVSRLIGWAREAGTPVLVDPKGADFERYRGATLITPNRAELEAVVGRWRDDEDLVGRAAALCDRIDVAALLVTLGEDGMRLVRRDGSSLHDATRALEVFDVTGAGDTVIATLGASLAAGEELGAAMTLANVAAGIVVGKLGTAAASAAELKRTLSSEAVVRAGVVDRESLVEVARAARLRDERLVFTNGCFDLLHAGHVAYLEQARALGDRLVVAVNSDASVRGLKGKTRPVNPAHHRMRVVAALGCVDWVVEFGEATPGVLIERLTPDVLVKGGDYEESAIVGAEWVREHGGQVVVLPYEAGCSTSAIIDAIRNGGEPPAKEGRS